MGSDFDPDLPTKYLQYLDANNLYGWAMSQPLPTGELNRKIFWLKHRHYEWNTPGQDAN